MRSLSSGGRRALAVALGALLALSVVLVACSKKVSQKQCDELVDHYAGLVVRENNPDASAAVVTAEQERERKEARAEDGFKNCTTEVQPDDFACAMKAKTSEGVLRCLE